MKHRKVGNVMTSDVVSVRNGTSFKEVAELLAKHRISGLPVVDEDDKVIGVISETDLMFRQADQDLNAPRKRLRLTRAARRSAAKARARSAGELMSAPPVTVYAHESIARSARTMAEHRVERLPVLDEEDRLVGIVTRRDLLQVFLRPDREIRAEVLDEVIVRGLLEPAHAVGVSVTDGVVTLEGRLERATEVSIAAQMTGQVDGVVGVVNKLTSRFDDSHISPTQPPAMHGVADDWLRKL
ncbi:CBS domain-containing protein [Actinacidiphila alni]|uniref:CBS domain-containing protein n=1 Tax=Actinacidiphila alni TaxID=380248 RepID=UPI00340A9A1E